MKDFNWFKNRIGSYIMRGTTEVFITNIEVAVALHKIQAEDYTFSDK